MDKVGFALLGYGAWGRYHAQAIGENPEAELVAVAARSEETCLRAEKELGVRTYQDYRQLLEEEDVNVADIVLPNFLHHQASMACLKADKHLLLEKPMALSIEECDDMILEARNRNRILYVGFEARLSPLWGRAKDMIKEGKVGRPLAISIELFRHPYRTGSDGWRYRYEDVGSWILEEPIHFFDLARWYLSSLGEPVSVYAQANSKQKEENLLDNFSCLLKFPQGSYVTTFFTLGGYEHHQTVKVIGDKGTIWASWSGATDRTPEPQFSLEYFDGKAKANIEISKKAGEIFELKEEIGRVVRAVQGKEEPFITGEDGREAVRLCLAAEESIRKGKVVEIGDFLPTSS